MSNFVNRRWAILPASDLDSVDFSQIVENTVEDIRFSNDRSEFFIKFDLEDNQSFLPSFVTEAHRIMSHQEILDYINTEAWIAPPLELPEDGY